MEVAISNSTSNKTTKLALWQKQAEGIPLAITPAIIEQPRRGKSLMTNRKLKQASKCMNRSITKRLTKNNRWGARP